MQSVTSRSSVERDKAAILHFDVLDVHVGPLDFALPEFSQRFIILHIELALILDLVQLSSHALDLVLQVLAPEPLQFELLGQEVQMKLER